MNIKNELEKFNIKPDPLYDVFGSFFKTKILLEVPLVFCGFSLVISF